MAIQLKGNFVHIFHFRYEITEMKTSLTTGNHLWILDGESSDVVERFPVTLIHQPTPFNDHNHIYNNILIFTVQQSNESQGKNSFKCNDDA